MIIKSLFKTLLLTFPILIFTQGFTQNRHPPTKAIDPDVEVRKNKIGPKNKKMLSLIKNNTKGILYGNRCFEEFTHKRGYEYVVQPKGQSRNRNEISRWLHNFGVKFVVTIKNGPFWRIKEQKKKKECRTKSGDYVG